MAEGDNLDRWMRKISVEHAETRWLALRLDDDVKVQHEDLREIKATQRIHTAILNEHSAILREHSAKLDEHSAKLQEHDARFDSVDSQLQSLTQMVGQVLERLPETPCES
jgi:division protein CdvB (Snf7/Vps24/ESCRT-III family)